MIAFYTFVPLYCPSCGTPTRLDRNDLAGKYQARQALSHLRCSSLLTDALMAASGGDMLERFIKDDEEMTGS